MLKILLVLLPLAASAACSRSDVSTCTKCGVGAIGMQFDYATPCNCNDNAGMYGMMCPKTGAPALPTCCSVDGKAATLQQCKCGTTSCQADQMCTAATNTCAYPVCAKTDGSAASTSETECQCGTTSCSKGQKCTASSNTCAYPVCAKIDGSAASTSETACQCGYTSCSKGEKCTASTNTCAPPTCGSGASTVSRCTCGTASCYGGQTCTASTNTCKSPTVTPTTAACKEDVVVTAACLCTPGSASSEAKIGQTCPSTGANKGDPQWPACKGSDVFKTMNQQCKCADKNHCGYGQKCTQTGDFKGICECVLSDDVLCQEQVPPSEKCPKTCDGHTKMGATAWQVNKCLPFFGRYMKFSAVNNKITSGRYSDSACTTVIGVTSTLPAGCNDDMTTFNALSPKNAAGGSTALQVAMPVALVAGLLGFILL